jgi:hypothetical protein
MTQKGTVVTYLRKYPDIYLKGLNKTMMYLYGYTVMRTRFKPRTPEHNAGFMITEIRLDNRR